MCGRKPNVTTVAPTAPNVAAPLKINNEAVDIKKEQGGTKAKGKKKLVINQIGTGTGVNI